MMDSSESGTLTSGQLLHTLEGHEGASLAGGVQPGQSNAGVRRLGSQSAPVGRDQRQSAPQGSPIIRRRSRGWRSVPMAGPCWRPVTTARSRSGTASTGQETFSFRGELLQYPWSPWFSPDARRLAWACLDGVIKIWDTTTGRLEIDQQSNTYQCRAVAFSPDGKRIAVAGFDGTLRLLDAATGREMLTIFAHPSLVADVAFSPDGHQLASASYDHTVRIWDATPLASDPAGRALCHAHGTPGDRSPALPSAPTAAGSPPPAGTAR